MPIPEAAPVPANPMKCPEPILLAKRDAPTYINREEKSVIKNILKTIFLSRSNLFQVVL